MSGATIAIIWIIGTPITAIILGAIFDREFDHFDQLLNAWVIAAIWPIILIAGIACIVIAGPFWLGRQIRKLWS